MAATTILDAWTFPTVDPDDIQGCAIPLFGLCEGGESISGVIFWILGQSQGQIRGHKFVSLRITHKDHYTGHSKLNPSLLQKKAQSTKEKQL